MSTQSRATVKCSSNTVAAMYDSFCDWRINNQFEDDPALRIQIAGALCVNLDGGCVSGPAGGGSGRGDLCFPPGTHLPAPMGLLQNVSLIGPGRQMRKAEWERRAETSQGFSFGSSREVAGRGGVKNLLK